MDPQGTADMRNLILRLCKELNKTVLISSHLLTEIQLLANRLLIINKGKKLVEGNTSELFDPAETLVELETTDNESTMSRLAKSEWSQKLQTARGNLIVLKVDKSQIPSFHKALVEMDVSVLSFQPRHSLEDYFIQLTSANQHVATTTN
jgi:ABC-type multidrug transport system ATPase subunit